MLYYITEYNFDADMPVRGPFPDEDSCWSAMKEDAEVEHRIDIEENQWETEPLEINREEGVIKLRNIFPDHEDITTWSIIDVPYYVSEQKEKDVLKLMANYGISRETAEKLFSDIKDILFK